MTRMGSECPWFPSGKRLRLLFLISVLLLATPNAVWAHPMGNFSVNRYSRLEVGGAQITLLYVIDMAEIPAFQERTRMDTDGDGRISAAEEESYLTRQLAILQHNLHLTVNGTPLPLTLSEYKLAFEEGQGGLQTLRLTLHLMAPLSAAQVEGQVEYRDENYQDRLGWQEIVVRAGSDVALRDASVPTESITEELRAYPADLLQTPLVVNQATFRFERGEASALPSPQQAGTPASAPAADEFASLIALPDLAAGTLLLALVASFGFGAAHALTPGHGKTIVAAYLVGSRGTIGHALFLGLTTTITHTAGVFALGLVTLMLSQYVLPEQLYPWLSVLSGLLVVGIGLSLFSLRLRHLLSARQELLQHHHAGYELHGHIEGQTHTHLPPAPDGPAVTWRSLLALGISGGLLPCPSALVVLLSAIALGRVGLGLLLILAFSLGLAGVLTAIGVLLVHAQRLFERLPVGGRWMQVLPLGSALLITLAGLGITLQALAQTGLWQALALVSGRGA